MVGGGGGGGSGLGVWFCGEGWGRALNSRNAFGKRNNNPILETREYRVEFDDGEVRKLTANVIVESMYAACDDSGNEYLMMDLIVDYRKNNKAVTDPDQKVVQKGQRFMRQSTVGWQLCVKWRDGSMLWKELNDLNESHTVETEKDAVAQKIYHVLEFNWWLILVLKKRLRIISIVKKRNYRYLKKTHKFGIEVPKSVAQTYDLDEKNAQLIADDASQPD